MTAKQKKTLLISAIVAGVLSLPMTWFTIQNAQVSFPGGFGGVFPSGFAAMSLNVTGFTGSVTMLIKAPLWFVIGVAIGANVLQLLRNSPSMEIPKLAEWITAIVGVVWITLPVLLALGSGRVTPALGWLLGTFCAVTPLVCLWLERGPHPLTEPISVAPQVEQTGVTADTELP